MLSTIILVLGRVFLSINEKSWWFEKPPYKERQGSRISFIIVDMNYEVVVIIIVVIVIIKSYW